MEWKDVTNLFLEQRKQFADWLMSEMKFNQDYTRTTLEQWVTDNSSGNAWYYVGLATVAQTTVDFTTLCGNVVADITKVGEGAQRGGWGWGADFLRLLNMIPAGRIAQWVNLKRLSMVAQDANMPYCTWVAVTQALRLQGVRMFASVKDMASALGLDASIAGGTFVHEFAPLLGKLNVKYTLQAAQRGLADVLEYVEVHKSGVTIFAMETSGGMHTIIAIWEPTRKCVMLIGRMGKIALTGRNYGKVAQEFKILAKDGSFGKATVAELKAAKPVGQMMRIESAGFAPKDYGEATWILSQIVLPLRCIQVNSQPIIYEIKKALQAHPKKK